MYKKKVKTPGKFRRLFWETNMILTFIVSD